MSKHLTKEMKEKVIAKFEQGVKVSVIAEHLMISGRSVYRTVNQYKNGEKLEPKTENCGKKPSYSKTQQQIIMEAIAEKPDITLQKLIEVSGLKITESAMSRILKKLGYKRKNIYYLP